MRRVTTEGERQSVAERSTRAMWLIVAFAVLLIGYPLGFVLLAGEATTMWFTVLYVGLALLALLAAFGFARGRRRRLKMP